MRNYFLIAFFICNIYIYIYVNNTHTNILQDRLTYRTIFSRYLNIINGQPHVIIVGIYLNLYYIHIDRKLYIFFRPVCFMFVAYGMCVCGIMSTWATLKYHQVVNETLFKTFIKGKGWLGS